MTDMGQIMKNAKLCIIVNVASKWAFASKNYAELSNVYEEYNVHGLEILAFPSRSFMQQEFDDPAEIKAFVRDEIKSTIPLMMLCEVNGKRTHPVFKHVRKYT